MEEFRYSITRMQETGYNGVLIMTKMIENVFEKQIIVVKLCNKCKLKKFYARTKVMIGGFKFKWFNEKFTFNNIHTNSQ